MVVVVVKVILVVSVVVVVVVVVVAVIVVVVAVVVVVAMVVRGKMNVLYILPQYISYYHAEHRVHVIFLIECLCFKLFNVRRTTKEYVYACICMYVCIYICIDHEPWISSKRLQNL